MKLIIANKVYSSWSLRPWIFLKMLGVPFEEKLIPFGPTFDDPGWKAKISSYSPALKVPILIDDDGTAVWDSLAIMDYVADTRPGLAAWPTEKAALGMARAIAAEMHSGFQALRSTCVMNLGKKFPRKDRGPATERDIARIQDIWRTARERFGKAGGGPFLFGAYSAADAMYAPVVGRFETYSIEVDPVCRAYMDAVIASTPYQEWRDAALKEEWIVPEDEVDEEPLADYRKTG